MKLTKRDIILFLIIIYFTFIGGTFYSQLNLWLRLANQLITTGILGVWLLGKLRQGEGWPRTTLDWALIIYGAANLVSACLGQSPRYSLEMMWFTLIHILAFYVLVDLIRHGWLAKLAWAFYMASAVVCLVGLAEFIAWYVGTPIFANFSQGWLELGGWRQPIPPYIYRLAITLNGSTPLSAYLALLTPPALGLILTLPRRDENRKALILWLVLALVVQTLTFSRAGILALGVSLSLLFVGWWHVRGNPWSGWGRAWSLLSLGRRLAIIAGCVLVAGATLFWLQNSFANRIGSTNIRLTLWQAALTIFQQYPISGAGPANFGRALLRLNEAEFPRLQIATAHNIYLNTAAELGLLGLLAGLALLWGVGWSWWRRWQQTPSQAERIRLIACGAALVGLATQTLVDTYPATPNMLVMLALVAYIVAEVKPAAPAEGQVYPGRKITPWYPLVPPTSGPRYPLYLALVMLLGYLAAFWGVARADLLFNNSFRQKAAGDLEKAVAQARLAQELDPGLTLRTFRLAFLEAHLTHQTGDPTQLQAAIEHYRAGLSQEPILGLHSANLAGLLWQQGQKAEAIHLLEQTIKVEPDPLYLVNLGYFYEQEGDKVQASQTYGQALALSPDLAASGFWQATPERAELWPQVVEAALVSPALLEETSPQAFSARLALAREDWELIKMFIQPERQSLDKDVKLAVVEFYLAQNQPEQAMAALGPEPESAEEYLLGGRIALLAGDEVGTERQLKTAVFLGSREANYYLGQLFEQQGKLDAAALTYQRAALLHAVSENIEVTIYGRLGGMDLAPQLLRIGPGRRQARPLLALAQLRQDQRRFEEAGRIYQLLLNEDPFLEPAQAGLAALESQKPSR